MRSQLSFDQGVTLIGGGEVGTNDLALAQEFAPGLVAADGGATYALQSGLMPEAVIGDFDSLPAEIRSQIPPDRLIAVAEQDSTDFEKCLSRIRAPFVIGVGFLGGRLDHALSVLSTMARLTQPPVLLLGATDIAFVAPEKLKLDLGVGVRLSLFPLAAAQGCSKGLHWPIDGIEFSPAGQIGTSNITTGPVLLEISGPMLIILPREYFSLVFKQHFDTILG